MPAWPSDATAVAMSSGLPSAMGRDRLAKSSGALTALAESRRQREQQEQLLHKAQEELQKAARLAKAAIERRVGGPEPATKPPCSFEADAGSSRPPRRQPSPQAAATKPPCSFEADAGSSRPPRRQPSPQAGVRPALRGAMPRRAAEASPSPPVSGVSASLRAAAALSPHRGFYNSGSPRQTRMVSSPPAGKPGEVAAPGRLAWAAPLGEADDDKPEKEEEPETLQSSPSWKRMERTVTQYVSRRSVTSSDYEEVCQRYEGHMNELKVLCETVGRQTTTPERSHTSRGLNFRDLQDEKDFRDFVELRDPLLAGRAARQRSCSPPQASQPRSVRVRSDRSDKSREERQGRSPKVDKVPSDDKSVAPPLLSAGVLSTVPIASQQMDSDLDHVRSLFCAQVPEASVLGIYRVENPTLEGVYSAVRDAMGTDCELNLWHGTSNECVPNIVLNGFNRAYSGRRHGTKLGHGSYFSASAAYSTRFCDRKRYRRTMFFSKVLVGAWAKGSPDMVEPPCKDLDGLVRFDCTVDDLECPVNFCIFRDFQAMPTYLLEFTT
ncbi:unnamed protein product [Effrenium voratum]|nr:unnamed protein product [Effrenium voratum]